MKLFILPVALTLFALPVSATPLIGSESKSTSNATNVGINANVNNLESSNRNNNNSNSQSTSNNRNNNNVSNRITNDSSAEAVGIATGGTAESNQRQAQQQTQRTQVSAVGGNSQGGSAYVAPSSNLSTNSISINERSDYLFPNISLPSAGNTVVGAVSCPTASLGASVFAQGQDGSGANYGGLVSFIQPLGAAKCNNAQATEREILETQLEALKLELSIMKGLTGVIVNTQ